MHVSSFCRTLNDIQILMVHLDSCFFLKSVIFFAFKLGLYLDKNCPFPIWAGDLVSNSCGLFVKGEEKVLGFFSLSLSSLEFFRLNMVSDSYSS